MRIRNYKEGMKIDKPCAIRNMPIDTYHKYPALSNSGLKTLLDCPARYYYKYLSPDYTPKEKPSFKIGKACHCLILEGRKEFEKKYWHNPYSNFVKDDLIKFLTTFEYDEKYLKSLRVNELKEIVFKTANIEPKEIELSANELNQIVSISRAIKNNPLAKGAFCQKGEAEISLFWQDEKTGIWLKCRPDWLPCDKKNIPDYKTTISVNPVEFFKHFLNFGYHIQAAFYKTGIRAVFGEEIENFFFVAQEKEEPFISQVFRTNENFILQGEKAMKIGIEKYLDCKEKGIWQTYSDKVIELSIIPKPDDIESRFDKENAICYAPNYIDSILASYEV